MKPIIVCLCGSTKFRNEYEAAADRETLTGRIVLTVGSFSRDHNADTKTRLDELHLRKIDLADEVLILNVRGYIGESTHRELAYAFALGKKMRFLDENAGEEYIQKNSVKLVRHIIDTIEQEITSKYRP
jgi:hypothetical protein